MDSPGLYLYKTCHMNCSLIIPTTQPGNRASERKRERERERERGGGGEETQNFSVRVLQSLIHDLKSTEEKVRFGWVSLFNRILTFLGY